MADADVVRRLEFLAPGVRVEGRKIFIEEWAGEDLSPEAKDLYDELANRFQKERKRSPLTPVMHTGSR